MRVLHVTTTFPAGPDDATPPFVLRLTEALTRQDVDCVLLTPSTNQPYRGPESVEAHRFRYAPWPWQLLAQQPGGIPAALKSNPWLYLLVPSFLTAMTAAIVRLARDAEVIHAHWSINGALAVLTQKIHKRPVITTIHGSDHRRAQGGSPYARMHRLALRGSAFTVGVSETIQTELERLMPSQAGSFRFIPNGVDFPYYRINPHDRPVGPPGKLLYVGTVIPRKGVETAVRALAALDPALPVSLTIAGDGPERQRLTKLAADLGVDRKVTFLGAVAPSQIPRLMAEHHALILPSYLEGRPSVVLEAMAAAMPILATDIDGTRELVRHGRNGWLFPPGDHKSLAQLLTPLLKGEVDHTEAGRLGRKWMEEHKLTWDETARQYQMLYSQVLEEQSKS